MPRLRELEVIINVQGLRSTPFPCSSVALAGWYLNPAYGSIGAFRLALRWVFGPNLPDEETDSFPNGQFLERSPDGFGDLDGRLSDRNLLRSLSKVRLVIEPTYRGPVAISEERGEAIRERLYQETRAAFPKTRRRVANFALKVRFLTQSLEATNQL